MKKSSLFQAAVVVGLVMASHSTHAADDSSMGEVVVTATRNATPIEQVGSTVYVVTSKEIEKKQKQTVAEVLETIPGVTVTRSGGIGGQMTSVYLRGGEARFALVLVNGIPVSDPSSPDDSFNFDRLNVDAIERIEVLQGSQSTLYGSRAMGGVINILTKKSTKNTITVRAEAGSFGTQKEGATVAGGNQKIQYLLDVSQTDSKGIPIALPPNNQKNGFHSFSETSTISITPSSTTDIELFTKYQRTLAGYDDVSWSAPYFPFDSNWFVQTRETTLGAKLNQSLLSDLWKVEVSASANKIARYYPFDYTRFYEGKNEKYSWLNTVALTKDHVLTLGVENTYEQAENSSFTSHHANITGIFFQDQLNIFKPLYLTIGGRIDDHSEYGSHSTYRTAIAYDIPDFALKLKSSLGTGFKAPSLYQLYSTSGFFIGNSGLSPERSTTWDAGIEKGFSHYNTKLSITIFHNNYSNLISYDNTNTYYNISSAKTYGVESRLSASPVKNLEISLNHTYTMTDDGSGRELAQRPLHALTCTTSYHATDQLHIGTEVTYTDSRYAYSYSTEKMGSYYLVNVTSSYDINKKIQIYGRVNNLFDRSFENFPGYNTPGIAAYAGLKVSF